ncbi:response regulator transcription factor [Allofustis seminis]|uniref:response regulator transcription factor n=1 Tax=Allofustis seminis TaxID=166939 RepID=UPI000361481A|nr:response regulator transcription factor [Allofustis seminis]
MIQLMIVDDHQMVRMGLVGYFSLQDDINVVAEAENGQQGVEKAFELRPDIILMDLVMDGMDGIEATQEILKQWPEAKIVILTSFIDDEKVYPAMAAGASGYILKTSSAAEIAEAVRKTFYGNAVIEEEVSEKLRQKSEYERVYHLRDDLTNRELEVLSLIAEGKSNQEIADELFITLKTVKTHVSNILFKLEVQDRTQAAIYALKQGLFEQ